MATTKKPEKRITIKTPKVPVRWANVAKPDTKFNADGVFTCDVILTPEQLKDIQAQAKPAIEKATAEWKESTGNKAKDKKRAGYKLSVPWSKETDSEGEETGNYVLKTKLNAQYKTKSGEIRASKPAVFDAKLENIFGTSVGRGSIVRLSADATTFVMDATEKYGISLRLVGVQVLELQEAGGRSAEQMGFAVEDGFEGEAPDEDSDGESSEAKAEGDDAGGDF